MSQQIFEQYTIPVTEWKTVDAGRNTIRIKGVALKGDVISKNDRQYIAKELAKSTNTFIGKPINLHHADPNDSKTNIGRLTWMDWDGEYLTYEGEVTKQPYVDMLRNKSAEIRGVSIQANYLHNMCPDCKKKFYAEEDFRGHMSQEHFKKVSAVPHGIIGEALTLVLSPEICGFSGTTVELAETARLQTLRLLETVIKTEREKEEFFKLTRTQEIKAPIAVVPRGTTIVGAVKEIKEVPAMKAGDKPVEPKTEIKESKIDEKPIPPKETPKIKEETKLTMDTYAWPTEILVVKETLTIPKLTESTPAKLALGEPFAHYENFAACVADNQDKDNPEAYCGTIKKQSEGETFIHRQVKEIRDKINEIVEAINKPLSVNVPVDNLDWQKQITQLTESFNTRFDGLSPDDLGWKEIKQYDDAPLRESFSKSIKEINDAFTGKLGGIKPYDDSPIKEMVTKAQAELKEIFNGLDKRINEIKPYDDTEVRKLISEIKPYDDKPIKETVSAIKPYDDKPILEKLTAFETVNKSLTETIQKQEQSLKETLQKLEAKDQLIEKVAGERNSLILEQNKKINDLDQKLKETLAEKQKLQETFATRLDNLEDKIPSSFKSKQPPIKPASDSPILKDTLRGPN
jgi:predicted  nucleic acid-binding Zn-ribbon protein